MAHKVEAFSDSSLSHEMFAIDTEICREAEGKYVGLGETDPLCAILAKVMDPSKMFIHERFIILFISPFQHPYPSEDQKKQLAQDTGLTILQVNNW